MLRPFDASWCAASPVLLVLVLALAACGGNDGGGATPSDDAEGIEAAVDSGAVTSDVLADADARADAFLDAGADTSKEDAPAGKLLFVGDFETGDLSQWPGVEQCAKGRITVYDALTPGGDPAPRQGTYAAHFHVLDTDVAPCTSTDNPRAQLSTDLSLFKPGDDVWEFWSMQVPGSFPGVPAGKWLLFQEDYGPPWDGPPQIGWDIIPLGGVDVLAMNRGAQYGVDTAWHGPLVKDKWLDFLVHKKFSNTTTGGGLVEAWIDGVALTFAPCGGCTTLDMQTMHATQSALAFFQNLYRAAGTAPTVDLYFDAVRIGTTRAIVEAP